MLSYALHTAEDQAPVILYLHGLGIAAWSWDPVREALPEFGALLPDLPGHGASVATRWLSIADTATRVAEIVDRLPGNPTVHLTGHSLGAYVGLVLLTQRPERFASATLSGFHIGSPGSRTQLKLAYIANGLVFRVPALLRRFASVFGDGAAARQFVEGARTIRSRTIWRAGFHVVDFEAPAGIDALTLPVLTIAGDREPEAIRSTPGKLEGLNPNVHGQVLDGRGHLWPAKEPALYADILRRHITGRTLPSPGNAGPT